MASISWKSPVSGGWTVGSDWSSGAVPGSGDDVAISVAGGYTVTLNAAISINSLTISDTSAALVIASGATESIAGNLSNSGNLQLDAAGSGGSTLAVGGTLTNTGSLQFGNGGIGTATVVTVAALNNTGMVNVHGRDLTSGATATLNVASAAGFGTTGVLTGVVNLNGLGSIEFGGGGEITSIAQNAQLNIQTSVGFVEDAGATGSNSALTALASNAGTFRLQFAAALATSGDLANSGFIGVDDGNPGGSSLTVGGTLTNTGSLQFGNGGIGTATVVTVAALNNTGMVNVHGRDLTSGATATLNVASAAGFGTTGVLTGVVNLNGLGSIEFGGGGEITSIAQNAQLNIQTSVGFVEDAGATGSNSALTGLTSNAGVFRLQFGAALMTSGGFANSGFIGVDDGNPGGSSLTVGGTLTNTGSLQFGNGGIGTATVVTVAALNNTGMVNVHGRDLTSGATATLNVASAAGFGTTGVLTGTVNLNGLGSIEFGGGGEITSIAQNAQLNIQTSVGFVEDAGATGSNSALTALANNAGTFRLQFGAALMTSGGFANSGFVGVDDGNPGGSSLAIGTTGGTLTNSGTFQIGNGGIGAATVVTVAGLNNIGTVNVHGRDLASGATATLNVASAAAFGTTGVLTGTVNLNGLGSIVFGGGGEITSIAQNAQLNIQTSVGFIEDAGATGSNSALTGLASNAGVFRLQFGAALMTSGGFANSGFVGVDDGNPGGSSLAIGTTGGTLTNSGTFQIGNGGIGAATVVTVAGLNNTGTVNVHGRDLTSGATAALNVASAAGFGTTGVLTGTVNLNGLGSIVFGGGGEITSIAQNAQLNIQTGVGFIEDAGATGSNSALTGLASNAGTFRLQFAAALATSGDLANSGFIGVDDGNPGGSSLTVGGTLTNIGGLQIGNTGISAATTVTATGLVNSGNITVNSKLGIARATLSLLGPGTAASLNTGAIASNADGIAIGGGARLVNGSSGSAAGLISAGYAGVVLSNNGALVNYGTVKGTGTGVSLEPAGSVFGAGVAVSNYGLLSGAVGIVDGGGGPAGTSDTVVNHGRISGTSGAGITLGAGIDRVDNFGTISGSNGTAVAFGSGAGTVVIEPGAVFSGVLGGLAKGDLIDFAHVTATGFGFAGGALTLFNHGTVVPGAVVAVSGTFTPADLALVSDGSGGVEIGLAPLGPVIVGTYYTPILLSNPAINNSATVTATGRVAPSYGDAIIGGAGVPGTVANLGTIAAASLNSVGISLGAGGLIANGALGFAGGYISGALAGVKIGGGSAAITNAGTIRGGSGILIAAGSSATVSNAGTIAGTAGNAVSLAGGTNRLILAPGASLQGKADGGGGKSVVEVATSLAGLGAAGGATGAADTAAAAIYVNLGSVTNFSALQVDPGAATDADGNLSFDTLVNQGQINLLAGDSLMVGTVAGAATGGTIDLKSGGSVHFTGAVAVGQTVLFRPPGGTVAIDQPGQFAAAITQFAATDLIDLPLGAASFQQYAGGILSLNYGGGTVALNLATIYATPQFQFTDDGQGGTDILVSDAVCFCRGTLILAERGEVAVEDLQVGERVVTLSGELKPIVWIGVGRELVTRADRLARPIIVRQDALADGVPHCDLYLTHGHALYLDGVLIPIENLLNHRSIRWDETARIAEYYHIELEDHDVVLANGAPAETYYDADNRALFHNTRDGSRPGAAKPTFAPVLHGGDIVDRVWTGLFARSGGRIETDTTDDPDLHVVVDGIRFDPQSIDGNCYTFALAAASDRLRLCSRTGVPSLLGITRHDHRRLGVAIEQIVLSQAGISSHFDYGAPQLREGGCYKHEDGFAWTDGDWALPARFFAGIRGAWTLEVYIRRNGMRYPIAIPFAGKQRAA